MKKIRAWVETAVLAGTLPLLVFAELNHTGHSLPHESVPAVEREYTVSRTPEKNTFDTSNAGSSGPRLIVVNL